MIRVIFAVLHRYSVPSHGFHSTALPPLFLQNNTLPLPVGHHSHILFKRPSYLSTYHCFGHLKNVLYIYCLYVFMSQWISLQSGLHSCSSTKLINWYVDNGLSMTKVILSSAPSNTSGFDKCLYFSSGFCAFFFWIILST